MSKKPLETHPSLTRSVIALKRYQLRHGKLPPNLDALVPDFLPAVLLDFMTGQPLKYRLKSGGGFLLYSVGEDGVDDGGDPRPTDPKKKVISLFDGRDYVWPKPVELKPK